MTYCECSLCHLFLNQSNLPLTKLTSPHFPTSFSTPTSLSQTKGKGKKPSVPSPPPPLFVTRHIDDEEYEAVEGPSGSDGNILAVIRRARGERIGYHVSVNTPCQYTLSIHPITHPITLEHPCDHKASERCVCPFNTPCQYTLSIHPVNTLTNTPSTTHTQ